jgi:hypothetical protein
MLAATLREAGLTWSNAAARCSMARRLALFRESQVLAKVQVRRVLAFSCALSTNDSAGSPKNLVAQREVAA